jgi:hypothetical protein
MVPPDSIAVAATNIRSQHRNSAQRRYCVDRKRR